MTDYINARAMELMLAKYTTLSLPCETVTVGILLDNGCYPYSEVRLYDEQGNSQFYTVWYNPDCTEIIGVSPIQEV